jgi:hypothetical protein
MTYKNFSFMAVIDGAQGKFFEFAAIDKAGAHADLAAIYGEQANIEIFLWQEV